MIHGWRERFLTRSLWINNNKDLRTLHEMINPKEMMWQVLMWQMINCITVGQIKNKDFHRGFEKCHYTKQGTSATLKWITIVIVFYNSIFSRNTRFTKLTFHLLNVIKCNYRTVLYSFFFLLLTYSRFQTYSKFQNFFQLLNVFFFFFFGIHSRS